MKNAVNALVLLIFMILAWASSLILPISPLSMELKINADSTAFVFKNLEDLNINSGFITLRSRLDPTRVDTFPVTDFLREDVTIKAKETLIIPFSTLISSNRWGGKDTLSKRFQFDRVTYSAPIKKDNKDFDGLFEFKF